MSAGRGHDDRSAAVRVITGPRFATRIEQRVAGADRNSYLAVAGILAEMLAGIEHAIDLGPAHAPQVYVQGGLPLPPEWRAAIDAFATSKVMAVALGTKARDLILAGKCDLIDGGFVAVLNRKELDDLREEVAAGPATVIMHRISLSAKRCGGDCLRRLLCRRYAGPDRQPFPSAQLPAGRGGGPRARGRRHPRTNDRASCRAGRGRDRSYGPTEARIVPLRQDISRRHGADTDGALDAGIQSDHRHRAVGRGRADLFPANHCVENASYILEYFRRTTDDRLLYGGVVVYGGQDPVSITNKIRPNLLKTFPNLKDVRID